MREYYQTPQPFRPKIFGMTASPIWNPKDPEGSLATLEKNLDAIAISVKDYIEELRDNSPRPVEVKHYVYILIESADSLAKDYQRIRPATRRLLLPQSTFASVSLHVHLFRSLGISLGEDPPTI